MPRDARAKNEALFRKVNKQVESISKTVAPDDELMEFLCECDNLDCAEKVGATRAEYEAVRAGATQFIVLPDHIDPRVEHVASQNERFAVVEKEGQAAQDAQEPTRARASQVGYRCAASSGVALAPSEDPIPAAMPARPMCGARSFEAQRSRVDGVWSFSG
jgi:hypothetical protein